MVEEFTFAPGRHARIADRNGYAALYRQSLDAPGEFWASMAAKFSWFRKWTRALAYNFDSRLDVVWIRFFDGGLTNITYNCLDRHLPQRADQVALIWEGNVPGETLRYTYRELHDAVCRCANMLERNGVRRGDRVGIYLQMVPQLPIAMLACARIGAIHSVVFGAFSADSLADRINDAACRLLITQDTGLRGAKRNVPMKTIADRALARCRSVERVIVVRRTGERVPLDAARDRWWDAELAAVDARSEPAQLEAEHPLFILYTSGSTGQPKGLVHTVGGYMVYAGTTHRFVFDHQDGDVFWCTADIGWITGHSYIVYGPLLNGATTVMFEGVPTHPAPDRFWSVIAQHRVTQFYTAPTAIRALMAHGDQWPAQHDLSSLRLLGSVGEPINPEAWRWYYEHIGRRRCPIVDTWWQTETGGVMITPLPGAWPLKPGSATLPFFGVEPAILEPESGAELSGECAGVLALKRPWPGQARTIHGDHSRYEQTYFQLYKGYYFTGDGARRDADGYYWITGRVDDVINVSGHRLGTAEVEAALAAHPLVAEAAVVGYPHPIKGQGIYAYVTLNLGAEYTDQLRVELIAHVRGEIGPIATPDVIHWAPGLPKTRSGKIMRRILRKIATGESDAIGDTSTLADPTVVDELLKHAPR